MKIILLVFLIIFSCSVFSGEKKALVIGSNFFLKNAVKDAQDVSDKLNQLNYKVSYHHDLNLDELKSAIDDTTSTLKDGDSFVFYYSGHAIQHNGVNYLIPNKTFISPDADVENILLNINFLIDRINNEKIQKIIILDACRDLPSQLNTKNFSKGLLTLDNLKNSFVAFSTTTGSTAADGHSGIENSPFTYALLQFIDKKGISIDEVFNNVRSYVVDLTDSLQVPWSNSSLYSNFCFNGCDQDGSTKPIPMPSKNTPPSLELSNKIVLKLANNWMMEMNNSSVSELVRFFNFPILNYFGDTNFSKERFIKQMRGYFAMWTKRTIELKELSVASNTDGQKKIFVNLVYKYNFIDVKGKEVRGKSSNTLIYEWIDGKYLITNISEKLRPF